MQAMPSTPEEHSFNFSSSRLHVTNGVREKLDSRTKPLRFGRINKTTVRKSVNRGLFQNTRGENHSNSWRLLIFYINSTSSEKGSTNKLELSRVCKKVGRSMVSARRRRNMV